MTDITKKEILVNRIYPAIKSCVSNRYKIVAGIFSLYAFIASSLNANKGIINREVSCFAAWIFTFFAIHNSFNYFSNAWEQYNLEETSDKKKGYWQRIWHLFRAEGLFLIAILIIIWVGYHYILKRLYTCT